MIHVRLKRYRTVVSEALGLEHEAATRRAAVPV